MTNKQKILIPVIVALVTIAGTAQAATNVYVSPVTATKKAGSSFDVTVNLSESASKVFAVEGKLVFNGLTCQGITVYQGVTVQTTPTCANPYFLLGIPSGATTGQILATVTVKGLAAGEGTVNLTSVDVIGEGSSLSTTGVGGTYTINADIVAPTATPAKTTSKTPSAPVQAKTTAAPVAIETPVQEVQVVQSDPLTQVAAVTESSQQYENTYSWVALVALLIIAVGGLVVWRLKKKDIQ